jgi:hypothetical protein
MAQDLKLSHAIPARDVFGVTIRKMEVIDEDSEKVLICCEEPHTFFVGKSTPRILTHNLMMLK